MSALPFTPQEFEQRLEKIRLEMANRGLDAFVVTQPHNIYYVSGYRAAVVASRVAPLHAAVITSKGEPRIMTRALERETAKVQWTKDPRLYMDHEDPFKVLHEILQESGSEGGKIGIEERYVSLRQFNGMRRALPNAEFLDATGLIERVRVAPSEAEVECIRKAAEITNIGFQKCIDMVKDGVYPYEVIGETHNAMYKAGQTDFVTRAPGIIAIWAGPKGGLMHDTLTTVRISKGDLVNIEIHGVYNLYKACAQGTIYVGDNPSAEVRETYSMTSNMLVEARNSVKPGATAGDIYDAANSVYRPARGADYFRRIGGSIGLSLFELDLVKGRQDPIKAGVSLLVQAVVDNPVLITCSSTILVTESGWEELTKPLLDLKQV